MQVVVREFRAASGNPWGAERTTPWWKLVLENVVEQICQHSCGPGVPKRQHPAGEPHCQVILHPSGRAEGIPIGSRSKTFPGVAHPANITTLIPNGSRSNPCPGELQPGCRWIPPLLVSPPQAWLCVLCDLAPTKPGLRAPSSVPGAAPAVQQPQSTPGSDGPPSLIFQAESTPRCSCRMKPP